MIKFGIVPDELGLRVNTYYSNNVSVYCPFANEKSPNALFNVEDGFFYCFSCGKKYTLEEIIDVTGGKIRYNYINFPEYTLKDDTYKSFIKYPLALNNEYLIGRKLGSDEIVKNFNLLASDEAIYIPIYDSNSEISGFQLRNYKIIPKYMFYGNTQLLYNIQNLKKYRGDKIYIVEGVFGVINAWKYGYENVFALTGVSKANNKSLYELLAPFEVNLFFDDDQAGYKSAEKFCLKYPNTKVAFGEADEIDWKTSLPEFLNFSDYKYNENN